MRDVTHLSSENILPVDIFIWHYLHNIIREYKKVIYKITHRYGNGEDDTNNMRRGILVEPLSDFYPIMCVCTLLKYTIDATATTKFIKVIYDVRTWLCERYEHRNFFPREPSRKTSNFPDRSTNMCVTAP